MTKIWIPKYKIEPGTDYLVDTREKAKQVIRDLEPIVAAVLKEFEIDDLDIALLRGKKEDAKELS